MNDPIDLAMLSEPQLEGLQGQFNSELELFTQNMRTLLMIKAKFQRSCDAVANEISKVDENDANNEGNILIPLTSSLYVPGKIAKTGKVLVEVGTGYFVEKEYKDAVKMLERKMEFIEEKVKEIQEHISKKKEIVEKIMMFRQEKALKEKEEQ